MRKHSFLITLISIAAIAAAIAALIVVFRDEIEYFFAGMRDRVAAAKEDMFTPDEYSDYADVE